jgi:RNase adaptor protein for sRNA GlmZ degradation
MAILLDRLDGGQVLAYGCNSGRHRSCIVVEYIGHELRRFGLDIDIVHRDSLKEINFGELYDLR